MVQRLPLGLAYAATQVNATIYRVGALISDEARQWATYYDAQAQIVVAARDLAGGAWSLTTIPGARKVRDAHNGSVLGLSSDGLLHLAYDHHNDPLRYRVSTRPGDHTAFDPERPMTGEREDRVTYPQFVNAPDGTLFCFYRDGRSGDGDLCLNRYAPGRGWSVVHHGLIAGLGRCNPYWWRPAFGPDGDLHLAWCWRDTPDAETNHDVCYARSADGGVTWRRSDGRPQPLPITPDSAETIDPVPHGSTLPNQCAAAIDRHGRPHLAHYQRDAAGVPQYLHLWHDGRRWRRESVGRRTLGFTLAGRGSLTIPISRPEIAIGADDRIILITRDAEFGGGARLYRSAAGGGAWAATDLPTGDLGDWEPTYDLARWRRDGVLSLFVLPVRQGNHEQTTDQPPQTASVIEWTPA